MTDGQITKCLQDNSHIYHLQQISPLTTTQLKFTKFVLGVGKCCPNMAIFGESAKIPFLARAHIHILKFWHRIKNLEETTLVNKAYRENITLNTNWCRTIQVLNAKYNLHAGREPDDFPGTVKKVITSDFTRYWRSRIDDPAIERKLSLYAKTKQKFEINTYTDLPFRDRQMISKFLCVSHRLHVETGRHKKTPRENRICQLCTLNKVEDEEHFILECPAYSKIRTKHFNNGQIDIRQAIDQEPLALATFLRDSYKLRDELLEEQPTETYHVAHRRKLKLTIRKGPKTSRVCNVAKDGLKVKIRNNSLI